MMMIMKQIVAVNDYNDDDDDDDESLGHLCCF